VPFDAVPDRPRSRRTGVDTALRTAAVWGSVSALAARRRDELGRPLRVVDIGGGTGGLSVPLAGHGHAVVVIDPSPDALASLRRRAAESGVAERISAVQGDAETAADLLADEGWGADLVCFHGTLEVVDDPDAALAGIARVLAPGGVLSLVTAQRLAIVWAKALAGQFDQARTALESSDGRCGPADPLPRRFDEAGLRELLSRNGFEVTEAHGIRLFSDLAPAGSVDSDADRSALLALEEAAVRSRDFGFLGQLGASIHVLATRT
jgi:S-adenosylmethionine-dependent methyltransferase